jgi:hypothetical protein
MNGFFRRSSKMKSRPNRPGVAIPALIAAALLSLQPGCRSTRSLPGQWLTVPVAAAGGVEDFSRKITSHLFENGMMIGLGNDENNLYIFFTPDFRPGGSLPGRATLTLWLNAQGGQARKLGLIHSFGPVAAPPPLRPGPGQGDDNVVAGPPGGQAQELLKIIDRGQGKETFIPADGSLGPAVRLTSDWGDFAYQLRIPLRSSGDWPGLGAVPGQEIAIGLLWSVEPPAHMGKEHAARPGGRPGMGPPPGMEGGERGPGGGMPGPGERMTSTRNVWVRTRLAQK